MTKKIALLSLFTVLSFCAFAVVSKTISLSTSGTLNTILTNTELSTITSLTITGNIDARDFKTMRDSMPVLANINIGAVNIIEYTGTEGTAGNTIIAYIANKIPDKALAKIYPGDGVLKSIILPLTANSIGNSAFYSCRGLSGDLVIPSTITYIGNSAFTHCSGFTGTLTIPESVQTIGKGAFSYCSGLTGSLSIPPSITSIENETFYKCSGLNGFLTIPNSVTSIGNYAFAYCSGLTGDLIIPNSVKKIDHSAFLSCSGFTGVLSIPSSLSVIERRVFNGCSNLSGQLTIPSSITVINESAFGNCSSFTGSLIIPSTVQIMGNMIFEYCSGIESVTISASVNSFGYGAFQYCSNLSEINITSNINTIPYVAFFKCTKLKTFTIPPTITSIEEQAFSGCNNLIAIIANKNTPIDLRSTSLVFLGVNKSNCILYVPENSRNLYANAFQWKDFINIIEMTSVSVKLELANRLKLFPNPTTSSFQINGFSGIANVTILDLSGNILTKKTIIENECISLSSFPQATYIVKITTQHETIEKKIIKQ